MCSVVEQLHIIVDAADSWQVHVVICPLTRGRFVVLCVLVVQLTNESVRFVAKGMKVPQLRGLCQKAGLSDSGRKAQLIARLQDQVCLCYSLL